MLVAVGKEAKYLNNSQVDFEGRRSRHLPHRNPVRSPPQPLRCIVRYYRPIEGENTKANMIDNIYWNIRQEYWWTKSGPRLSF